MTYANLADWVENNFDISSYRDSEDLLAEVKNDFERNGVYFPEQANQYILDKWSSLRSERRASQYEDQQLQYSEPEIMSFGEGFSSTQPIGPASEKQSWIEQEPKQIENKPTVFGRLKGFLRSIFR